MLDEFTTAYIECALWTNEFDDLDFDDIDSDTLSAMIGDCQAFQERAGDLLDDDNCLTSYGAEAQAGHDFWLTRNGHGTGFWDHYDRWEESASEQLDALAKEFGETWLELGDDTKVYQL